MSPNEFLASAQSLRAQGRTYQEVADALGASRSRVYRVLNPAKAAAVERKRRSAKRAWERKRAAERRIADGIIEPDPIPGVLWLRDQRRRVVGQTLVDIEDWYRFKHLSFGRRTQLGYAGTQIDGRMEYLHRLICGLSPGQRWPDGQRVVVDHINRDPLDNRRANLHVGTQKENCANRGGMFEKNSAA